MKIAIAYNTNGANLADAVKTCLLELKHEVYDYGATTDGQDDADIAYAACKQIPVEHIDRAVLFCGAGLCTCIVANKMKGLYAAPCNDVFEARQARYRYNTNVLCLSVRWLDANAAEAIVKEWLKTPFHKSRRNDRALLKIKDIEKGKCPIHTVLGVDMEKDHGR